MKRIGILYHPKIEVAHTLAEEVKDFLTARGVSVWLCSAWEGEKAKSQVGGTELILTIGGDGTMGKVGWMSGLCLRLSLVPPVLSHLVPSVH